MNDITPIHETEYSGFYYCEDCDITFDGSDGCPCCDDGDCLTVEEAEEQGLI